MLDWLDRQRQKTKAERARIAFFIAFSCTLIIALLWFFTLPAKFQVFKASEQETRSGESSREFNEAYNESKNSVENAIESVRQQYAPGTTTAP